eukprot:CAMPEP_0114315618 /NCGR_PEP_ID=MMETSP0059-20121206/22646_1 /TAXON_ID=36894 /ORGANISM="Pyramimonas parkeae, Strain CCMP726" /LENGTH=177 /DNA_ID=CAMNT_0001441255 /DNA_START=3 /DNA_END=536 /DNA_ORIENTATION=-
MIEAGFTVIAQDADIVWTRDPRPVYSQPSLIDIRSELAPAVGSRSPANTGFVIVQPNKKTLAFAHAMVHLVPITYWRSCDQLAFNSVLRHWRFRQLHYESLPRRLFLDLHIEGGRGGTRDLISNETFLLHAVGSEKEMKFLKVGEWYFRPGCSHFSQDVYTSMPESFVKALQVEDSP